MHIHTHKCWFFVKKSIFSLLIIITFFLNSCDNPPLNTGNNVLPSVNNLKISNGTLIIPNRSTLTKIAKDYRENVVNQNEFIADIKNLQSEGFRPLLPYFSENDDKKIQDFVLRKRDRIKKRNEEYGIGSPARSTIEEEMTLKDDIIADPVLTSLLNEDREIIIADSLYKYTEMGLFFVKYNEKQSLYDYLNNLTPEERKFIVNRNYNEKSTTAKPEEVIEFLNNGVANFRIKNVDRELFPAGENEQGGGGTSTPNDGNLGGTNGTGAGTVISSGSSSSSGTIMGNGIFNINEFGVCNVEQQGFWEQIFGTSEDCYEHFIDDKRVCVSFWNQNYFIYSSIGCETYFQKREVFDFFGIFSIVWWEKSYTTTLELGVNDISYQYNFNVPAYNIAQYNYETTFFEYNGIKYNHNGQVISTVPASAGNLLFATDSNQEVIDMTIIGYNFTMDGSQINSAVDQGLNTLINGIQDLGVKQHLWQAKNSGSIKTNVLYAEPFSNNVRFYSTNVKWVANDDHSISNIFDFNLLLTYNSSYSGFGDYLQGLNGATSYTNVKANIYGAALHNNFWKGRRLIYNE